VPRRPLGDETARLFLQIANSLDRWWRIREGTRLKPWDLDPVRLPFLEDPSELRDALVRLARRVRAQRPGFRRDWLTDHLPTLEALGRLVRGRVPSLPEQVRLFYGLPVRPAKESDLDELREEIREVLGVGRDEELRDVVEAWDRGHGVRTGDVMPTMALYLRDARKAARKLFELPPTERSTPVATHRSTYSGYCYYTRDYQSTVKIDVDLPWTWPALRDMATHEAYPGHHVHQCTREWEYLEGEVPRETAVSLAACPMGPVEEGIAENAMVFIGWTEEPEDRMTLLRNRLRWGTEVNLAWMVHREEPRRELLTYAMHSGLLDWRQAVRDVRYAADRAWASYASCYWYGAALVRKHFERLEGDPAFFDILFWKPHTVRTLDKALRRV
jgi:hypothetical protein